MQQQASALYTSSTKPTPAFVHALDQGTTGHNPCGGVLHDDAHFVTWPHDSGRRTAQVFPAVTAVVESVFQGVAAENKGSQ